MPLLQSALKECEDGHFSPEEIGQAAKVAKRLLGPTILPSGTYMQVIALEDLQVGDILTGNHLSGNAKKWIGEGHPIGMAISAITKGNYGWILIKS